MKQRRPGRKGGFTIIELMVVLVVLGILASLAMPLGEMTVARKKEEQLRRGLWEIRDAIDAYKRAVDDGKIVPRPTSSGYPPTLDALVAGVLVTDQVGAAQRVFFLRRVPRDPFQIDPAVPPSASWGLRSYASTAERPQAGDDVYDVYSTSTRTGLNGLPYREW